MSWQEVKAMVNGNFSSRCKPHQVWWASIGENIGNEQNGKGGQFLRPVIIIQTFRRNLCFIVPLTTNRLSGKEFMNIEWITRNGEKRSSVAMLSQARTLSTKRLIKRGGYIEVSLFHRLRAKFFSLLS